MTAHATIEERQRCLASGMNDHVSKPIDPDHLFETVARFFKPPVEDSATRAEAAVSTTGDLPEIDGLDAADGLARVGGNRKLYAKLLRLFVDEQGSTIQQVTAAQTAGDVALAVRLAHTLRGVAGNIGASPVQVAAARLEGLLHDGAEADAIEAAKRGVSAALDPLVAGLRAVSSTNEPTAVVATAESNPAQSRDAAARLATLLSDLDPGAADFLEANHAALRPLFGTEGWLKFQQRIRGYAFADAHEQLNLALKDRSV
jgi:two-component system sensor histidine kinase/response regulator